MSCLCLIFSVQLDHRIYLPHVSGPLWYVLKLIVGPITLSDVFGITGN